MNHTFYKAKQLKHRVFEDVGSYEFSKKKSLGKQVTRIIKKAKSISLIPLPKLMKQADEVFAKYIRTRDGHCYAEDIPEEKGKCRGYLCNCHLFKRGKKDIRFDEANCNAGCMYHNQVHDHTLNPQPHIYTNWFIKKYGLEKYQELNRRSYILKKWTRKELFSIIERYKELV